MRKIYVSVSIDVENPQTPLFEKRYSDNRIWSNGYGIEKIIDILNKHKIAGSFFCNIYEYPIWGRTEINRVLKYIDDNGQDVELHTHPIWIDEKRRENMFQFPLSEQSDIIKFGLDYIEACIGKRPLCHRAGAYGFDDNTLKACKENNLRVDSSNFYNHQNCKTNLTQNEIVKYDGILEAPITFYEKDGKIIKTDLDWIEEDDFWQFYNYVKQDSQLNFVNLFLHSYSLTKTIDNYETFISCDESVNKFERILKTLSDDKDCEIIPLSKLPNLFSTTENKKTKKVTINSASKSVSVCHIGGAHSIVLRDLVKELDGKGYKQCVFTYSNVKKNLVQENVNVYYYPYNTYNRPEWGQKNMEKALEKKLGEILQKESAELVHGHKLEACCVPVWMAKEKYSIPTLISPHNLLFQDYRKDSIEYLLTEKCLKSADFIAQGQKYMLNKLQEVYNLNADRLFTGGGYPIYFNGHYQNISPESPPTILCARQMGGEQYAQHLIIDAFPEVLSEFPDAKLILLIGHSVEQGRETFDRLKTQVKEKQLENNVEFIPYVLSLSDLDRLMANSDIVMSLNYLDPGLAGTSLSAAYSGAITFVSDSDFPVDIEDGINGFRVKHESKEIAGKLVFALKHRNELRKKFYEINKEKLKKYSAEEIVKQVENVYQKVLRTNTHVH